MIGSLGFTVGGLGGLALSFPIISSLTKELTLPVPI